MLTNDKSHWNAHEDAIENHTINLITIKELYENK